MPFVLDASFAASWFLPDEASPATNALLDGSWTRKPLTPSLFRHEMRIFDGRATRARCRARNSALSTRRKTLRQACGPGDDDEIVDLAMKHNLTSL